MTYLRADQEISQLSLETSKAAEHYRYLLIKTQLCCTIYLRGPGRWRKEGAERQEKRPELPEPSSSLASSTLHVRSLSTFTGEMAPRWDEAWGGNSQVRRRLSAEV